MRIFSLIGLCALAFGLATANAHAMTALRLEPFITRGDFAGLKTALASESDDLSLAQNELVRVIGADGLKAITAKPNGKTFLRTFLGDQAWLEMFLASGPVGEGDAAADGVMLLYEIWNTDKSPDARGFRPLATALALNLTVEPFRSNLLNLQNSSLRPSTPVTRYFFFKNAFQANRLNPIFRTLKTWSLRFVVSANYEDQAMAWALDNVNLPAWRYVDACWFAEYRGVNAFGDTVQGPLFYMPWREKQNRMEATYKNGGVCGALSTFGAVAARAHGIPSYTVGQPGHCAYAVRLGPGDWAGGFGGPAGGVHQYFWKGSYYYILLMEDAFAGALKTKDGSITFHSDENAAQAKMLDSQRHLWKARDFIEKGDRRQAERECVTALEKQPANFCAWQLRVTNATADPSVLTKGWQGLADEILVTLGNHTRPMCDLLEQFEEKQLFKSANAAEKIAWFGRVHKTISETNGYMTWDWKVDSVLARQIKMLPKNSPEQGMLFQNTMSLYAVTNERLLGQLFDWGIKNLGENAAEKCITALTAAIATGGDHLDEKETRKILSTAIVAAEKAKSREAFQAAVNAAAKYVKPTAPKKLERPEGLTLVSGDGLLVPSSSAWDRPLEHGGVLTESGGFFHTGKEKNPHAIVELRNATTLTGILLINSASNPHRQKPLIVSVSTDGATWHKIWETDKVSEQWFIPLAGKSTRARWVKVETQPADEEFFHLRGILVYGESAR